MSISLRDPVQMDWTAEQMAEQVYCWLEDSVDAAETYPAEDLAQENASGGETAPAAPESPGRPRRACRVGCSAGRFCRPRCAKGPERISIDPVMP